MQKINFDKFKNAIKSVFFNKAVKEENISAERTEFLKNKKRRKNIIMFVQIMIVVLFVAGWELLAHYGIIDSFLMSSPSRMVKTFKNLIETDLFTHIKVTCAETLTGFLLGAALGLVISVVLWWSPFLSRIAEPFLVVLNALPKVALGPIIIVWVGAGTKAIVVMALAISLVVTVLEMLHAFNKTNAETIKMAQTFGATRRQVFSKIVFPSNITMLFTSLKINIGLSLVGVISGEFLVSKAGLGYLIVYGGQVFKLDLVMVSVVILALVAALMYETVVIFEKLTIRMLHHQE